MDLDKRLRRRARYFFQCSGEMSAECPASAAVAGLYVRSVFYRDARATASEVLTTAEELNRDGKLLLEIPRDQYEQAVRLVNLDRVSEGAEVGDSGSERICRIRQGTVTYSQALRVAQGGRISGVAVEAGTEVVHAECPCGISFAIDFARARWAGADEGTSVVLALSTNLNAGPTSAIGGVLAAGGPDDRARFRSVAAGGAFSGLASSPISRAALDRATYTLSSLAGGGSSGQLGALAAANPVTATLAMGVANLDFYRAALARSISWKQYTKNTVVKTSAILGGASGWASGAALGSGLGGPFGALIGAIVGGLSGGSLGSAGAKRVADRFLEDDASRLIALVKEQSELVASDYLLTEGEVDALAARIKTLVTPSWLRSLFQASRNDLANDEEQKLRASAAFAKKALESLCQDIVDQRTHIVPPSAQTVLDVVNELRS